MPMSESEKHQGNALVHHFNDKFDSLPIKKRRFLYKSSSPPPQIPSHVNEESFIKTQGESAQSLATCSVSCKSELGGFAVDKTVAQGNIKNVEDISGISILAAAACSTSLGKEFGYAEDGFRNEEPFVNEGPVEASTDGEVHSFSKGLMIEESINRSGKSIGGALSRVTAAHAGELASISTDCNSVKVESLEKRITDPFCEDIKPTVSSDVSSMRDEDMVGSQKLQDRDDRLHWDLNVVMDVWEQTSDYQNSHTDDYVSQGSRTVVERPANRNSVENQGLLNEPESSLCNDEKKLLHYEPSKSLDQCSQGNTRNSVGDINHKDEIVSIYNISVSSECKSAPSFVGDGMGNSAQPLVSKYTNQTPPILNTFDIEKKADSEPTGVSVTKNTIVSVIDTQVKCTAQPTLNMTSDKLFDDSRQSLKNDDNDSRYEDGELVSEDYDAVNGKTEHIDNVLQQSSDVLNASDHNYSEPVQFRRINHRDACNADFIYSAAENTNALCLESVRPITDDNAYGKDDKLLKVAHSGDEQMKVPASNEMFESNSLSSATLTRFRDVWDGKGSIGNPATNSPHSEGADTRAGCRKGFLSQSNDSVGRDMYFREDQTGNRSKIGYSYMKCPERARYSRQTQPRVHNGNDWNGSSDVHRGFKSNYLPTHHTLMNNADEDGTKGKEDRDGAVNTVSYPSHDRSIADVGEAGNFQSNHNQNGDLGSDRPINGERFQRYDRQMDHGAGRGRYHRHHPAQRDKCFSPNERRGYQFVDHSRSRSPSRSRTRSPDPRGSPYLRHTSRSPNFRSEARMMRIRSPHQQRFRPFQRDNGSPPPPRWIGNRKDEPGHFNNRRNLPSTGTFRDSARNSKPVVHYRQNTHRFSEMEGNSRLQSLEGNFESRRQLGVANRLSRDNDDGFMSSNREVAEFHGRENNREIANRNEEMPRRFSRNMCERDGTFHSNFKQFGINRTDSSRNMDSGDPYRPIYPGRYNETGERRRRYMNDGSLHRFGGAGDNLPIPQSSCDYDAGASCVDDLPGRQREGQQPESSEQEKKLGEASESMDVQVPAEKCSPSQDL